MTPLYFNERGGFRAEYLHVKYPEFAAPAPVLAEPLTCADRVPDLCAGVSHGKGEARESTLERMQAGDEWHLEKGVTGLPRGGRGNKSHGGRW